MSKLTMSIADVPFDVLTLVPSHFSSISDVKSFALTCKTWHDATLLCPKINARVKIALININEYHNFCCGWNLTCICVVFFNVMPYHSNVMAHKSIVQQIGKKTSLETLIFPYYRIKRKIIEQIVENCINLKYIHFGGIIRQRQDFIKK